MDAQGELALERPLVDVDRVLGAPHGERAGDDPRRATPEPALDLRATALRRHPAPDARPRNAEGMAGQELELARRGGRRHGKREQEPGEKRERREPHLRQMVAGRTDRLRISPVALLWA